MLKPGQRMLYNVASMQVRTMAINELDSPDVLAATVEHPILVNRKTAYQTYYIFIFYSS